jgi:hypothetical protein
MPPEGSACTAIITPLPVVMYPAYNVLPMYIGKATKCAWTPLIVMSSAASTAARFAVVILPSEVVIAVLYVMVLPLYVPLPTVEYDAVPAPVLDRLLFAPAP